MGIKKPKVNLDELKAKLLSINPSDFHTGTKMSEILKNSSDFKIKLLKNKTYFHHAEQEGSKIIKLTFTWFGGTEESNRKMTWYMDVEEFFKMKTRFVIVEKKIKNEN